MQIRGKNEGKNIHNVELSSLKVLQHYAVLEKGKIDST